MNTVGNVDIQDVMEFFFNPLKLSLPSQQVHHCLFENNTLTDATNPVVQMVLECRERPMRGEMRKEEENITLKGLLRQRFS